MRYKLRFLVLFEIIGVVLSGGIWLAVYHASWTPALDFDGPALLGMILTLTAGWLLFTLVGLALYLRGNRSKKITQAMVVVILCGLITGVVTGYTLTNYASSKYSSFCERHPKMC